MHTLLMRGRLGLNENSKRGGPSSSLFSWVTKGKREFYESHPRPRSQCQSKRVFKCTAEFILRLSPAHLVHTNTCIMTRGESAIKGRGKKNLSKTLKTKGSLDS